MDQGQRAWKQEQKFWAKPDEMWLGDKRTEQNPPDDFRKTYVPKPQRSRMVAGKAMTQDFTSAKDGKVRTS